MEKSSILGNAFYACSGCLGQLVNFVKKGLCPVPRRTPDSLALLTAEHGRRTGRAEWRMWLKQNSTQRIVGWGTEYVPKPPQLSTKNESGKTKRL